VVITCCDEELIRTGLSGSGKLFYIERGQVKESK
jgi:hypothetical protein